MEAKRYILIVTSATGHRPHLTSNLPIDINLRNQISDAVGGHQARAADSRSGIHISEALKKIPKNLIHFNNAPSGLNILLRMNTKLSEAELIKRALDVGILVTLASEFYCVKANLPHQPEVLFEFGSLPEDKIEKVVVKLYTAWFPKRVTRK